MYTKFIICAASLYLQSGACLASQWVNDVEIVKMSTYQHSPAHFVWLSSGVVSECESAAPQNPTLVFLDNEPGGKSLMATLTTALVSKRKIDVNVNGCDIAEVYLK